MLSSPGPHDLNRPSAVLGHGKRLDQQVQRFASLPAGLVIAAKVVICTLQMRTGGRIIATHVSS
jgi:hypothetical protein